MTDLPLEIWCSNCNNILFQSHFDLELEGALVRTWTVVDFINVICPHCKQEIEEAADDFTRALEEIEGL